MCTRLLIWMACHIGRFDSYTTHFDMRMIMITKKQWNQICDLIRQRRSENKDVYYGKHQHKIQACFAYRNMILLSDEIDIKLTHDSFKNCSYKEVKNRFYYIEIKSIDQ